MKKDQKEITGVIYKFENKINGKIYIGQSRCERRRYFSHIQCDNPIYEIDRAIKLYGIDNFDYSILESFNTYDLEEVNNWMDEKEVYYIQYYNSMSPNGYNLLSGGNHPIFSDETRNKISETCKGEKNGFYNKTHTLETRQKMSESAKKRSANRKGCKQPKEAVELHKKQMKDWWIQFKQTEEYIEYNKNRGEKISAINKQKRYKPILCYINDEFIKEYNDWKELTDDLHISQYILFKKLNGHKVNKKYDIYKFIYKTIDEI